MTHVDDLIHRSFEDDIAPSDRARLDAHLAECERCRRTRADLALADRLLAPREPLPALPRRRSARGRPWALVAPVLLSAAVLVMAVVVGTQLGSWRTGGTASSQFIGAGTSLAELVRHFDVIVIGTVEAETGTRNTARDPYDHSKEHATAVVRSQDYRVRVESVLKGSGLAQTITVTIVRWRGSRSGVAEDKDFIPLQKGQRYVLFFRAPPPWEPDVFAGGAEPNRFRLGQQAVVESPLPNASALFPPMEASAFVTQLRAAIARPVPTPDPQTITESQAFERILLAYPAVSFPRPEWLPPTLSRDHVRLDLPTDRPQPFATVTYVGPGGAISYGIGDRPEVTGSGIGLRVRGVPAALKFETSLWTAPSTPARRQIRWQEGDVTYTIESLTFSGDDLMRVAWSLERAGAPPPKHPVRRPEPGACARPGEPPEATVRALLSLAGSGRTGAVADCFADEALGEMPQLGQIWASLRPQVTEIRREVDVGGRAVIRASWTWIGPTPRGNWTDRPTYFFEVGLEDGLWRIFSSTKSPTAPPP